jgi:hypothetical protein
MGASTMPHNGGTQWQRVVYRLRQFVTGLQAQVTVDELHMVAELLPTALLLRFQQMPVDAQRHSLNVLAAVRAVGFTQREMALAALLHDVGKVAAIESGVSLGLWLRGPLVILEALWPQALQRLCSADASTGWRYLLYVQQEHPRIGATWARAAGCPPVTCWLIDHHQDKVLEQASEQERNWLAVLQQADASN